MEYSISPIRPEDREPIIDIFNYYVENSFAAYPESKLPYQAFDKFLKMSIDLPTGTIKDQNGKLLGFGMLRTFNQVPVFSHTVEITYFIDSDYTGKGIGKTLLEFLERMGRESGITIILANISSLNTGSINFHKKNDFVECGRFKKVGKKNGQIFDMIWKQKMLNT